MKAILSTINYERSIPELGLTQKPSAAISSVRELEMMEGVRLRDGRFSTAFCSGNGGQ